jgi:hypothetical protein
MQLKEQRSWKDKRIDAIHRLSQLKNWTKFDDSHPCFDEWQLIINSKAKTKKEYKEQNNGHK